MRLRRVWLVTPAYHCGMVESAGVWMPLGLAYLAGSLRAAGFDPHIYDAMSRFHDLAQIRAALAVSDADVVAVTAQTPTTPAALEVLRIAREELPEAVTVIGGIHPTFMAEELLRDPAVDFVVRGEGESTLPELLACIEAGGDPARVRGVAYRAGAGAGTGGGADARAGDAHAGASRGRAHTRVVVTPPRALAPDLDALPVAWDALEWPLYHYRTKPGSRLAIVSWARGCTNACSFCSQQRFYDRTWRARSVDAVVSELRMLRERFGVDTVEIADEHPTHDAARWERILDAVAAEDLGIELLAETRADDVVRDERIIGKYRDAGLLHMYVGVETVRQDRLDRMRKGLAVEQSRRALALLNDAGIITETSFLLGWPEDTRETVEETLRLSLEYAPDLAFFLSVTPWPYSDLAEEVRDRIEVTDYARYNLIEPIIRPDGMTRAELSALLSDAFATFYRERMRTIGAMPAHKREYMGRVARLLFEESYLAREVAAASAAAHLPGGMPDATPERIPPAMPADTPPAHVAAARAHPPLRQEAMRP